MATPIAELARLNDAQRAAVEHPPQSSALLVVAGAGSGKTLTLAARVAWLVQQGADPQRLLLITFSRRAAAEMAQRAGRLLHQAAGLPPGTAPPALPWCGTFHSVAARLLREAAPHIGLAPGFTVLDGSDAQDLLGLVREQLGLAQVQGRQRFPLAATCLAIASRCINTRQTLDQVLAQHFPWCAPHEAALQRLFAAYTAAKQEQHSLDFDDLLLAWWHLLQAPGWAERLRARFDHVLVDELQDVNTLQADIVHALRPGGRGLTAVGDDAQSIYAFRGAEVRHILGLPQRCEPPARLLALEQNYRSTPAILAAANAVIGLAEEGFPKRLWSTRGNGPKPRLVAVLDEAAQARGVVDAVLQQREQGVLLRRQAVLFRTASHSAALELELLRRQVPFVKYGGLRFLEAAHVKDVLALLRWADNPASRLAALRSARLVPGMGPASVARLLAAGSDLQAFTPPRSAAPAWAELCALMTQLRSAAARWPHDLQAVIDWYQPQLERLHEDARARRADLDQLLRLAAGHGNRQHFVTELALDPPSATSNEAGPPLRDEDYLVLSTIHSAKGQEWSAVQVLNVVDGCLPADMATGRQTEIEEERRLLYVAMTRARDALQLWVPQRFHVTQQRALGSQHLYGGLSRFIPAHVQDCFEWTGAEPATFTPEPEHGSTPAFDLQASLRAAWR